jgi:CBS domain-containing protein
LHNGTVYRWNRPCYGVRDGTAHLRIENRVLPAGPTVRDEIANAAVFFGLMSALGDEYGDVRNVMAFDDAVENFVAAARHGLKAQFTWIGGKTRSASELLLDHLLPLARQGLASHGIDAGDIDLYLGVIEDRVRSGRTGAQWIHESLSAMAGQGTRDQRLRALTQAMLARQREGKPVHSWPPAALAEVGDWRASYRRVGQYMTTDLFTVRPQDLVDLAASLMEWEHIRHVPVEDDDGRLVGLVSHRALLRLVGQGVGVENREPIPVEKIMTKNPVTVTPETSTLEAIALMRRESVGCLPVVRAGSLVGMVTERDLIGVAARVFEEHLREGSQS